MPRILRALALDTVFKPSLSSVPLDRCVTTACRSTSPEMPSAEELASARKLVGVTTLAKLAADLARTGQRGDYLYVHVDAPQPIPPPSAPSSAPSSPPPRPTFRSLLESCRVAIDEAVFNRALLRFSSEIGASCRENNPAVAVAVYERTATLPFTATAADFRARGIKVTCALLEGSELTICYRGARQLLLKPLTEIEYNRAARFLRVLDGRVPAHITPFQLPPPTAHSGKRFMLMPRYLQL